MRRKAFNQWVTAVSADVRNIGAVRWWRDQCCRRTPKQPLQPGQTGRTHKRKPRGTRNVKNMGWRQYEAFLIGTGAW